MSEAQNNAFELAVASVAMETNTLSVDVVELLRQAIVNDWSTAEIVNRLFPTL